MASTLGERTSLCPHSLCKSWTPDVFVHHVHAAAKTEVVVFNGPAPGQWHVVDHVLPQSATFRYLSIVLHESDSMRGAFARLAQNGKGAVAHLHANYKKLVRNKSLPMMRRLFDAVVLPTVSYGCEFRNMLSVQVAFFRHLGHLRRSVTPPIILHEFAERPWLLVVPDIRFHASAAEHATGQHAPGHSPG